MPNFHKPCVKAALDLGYEVYVGISRDNAEQLSCDLNIKFYDEHIYRNVLAFKDNYIAFKNLMNLLKTGNFEVIHCNTPIGGVIGRLCGKIAKIPKVIYTAHGFHFHKKASLINRILFKWAELFMARYTDAIITINNEDFQAAKKFRLRNCGKVYYVPGVGVETAAINEAKEKRKELLEEIGAANDNDSILLISVGDLNKNKNFQVVIKALNMLSNSNVHYVLCGIGEKRHDLISLTQKNKLEANVHFLGYRSDVPQLLKSCDIYVIPSRREGLSRSLMEAMAAGLPCIASAIRGNVDLIENGKGGFLCDPDDVIGFAKAISVISSNEKVRKHMGEVNLQKIKKYDVENVSAIIKEIYNDVLS